MTEATSLAPQPAALTAEPPIRGTLAELVKLGWPIVLTQLSTTLMGVVDSAFVGRLGAAELGAVALANTWSWTLFSLFLGSASAVQTFVAQAQGAGDERRCGTWAWQGLWGIVPPTALAAVATYYVTPLALPAIFEALGSSPALLAPAIEYMQPRALGMAALGVIFVWNGFFRGVGMTWVPLVVGLLANVVNAVGDYALIFGEFGAPRLGVAGAAIATAGAEFLDAALLLAIALHPKVRARFHTQLRLPDATSFRRLARTGLPIGAQWVFDSLSFAVFTLLLAAMSAESVAASHAFIMIVNVSFMVCLGVSGATQTLVGRAVGGGEPDLAVTALKNGMLAGVTISTALAVALTTIPETLMRIFTADPNVLALGVSVLRLGAVFQLLDAIHIVAIGALRGAGDTFWPAAFQTVLAWLVFVPGAWLFGVHLGHGLTGAYVGGTLYVALLAGGLVWRFAAGTWRGMRI
jgi:MATE family multidrug resistance protein